MFARLRRTVPRPAPPHGLARASRRGSQRGSALIEPLVATVVAGTLAASALPRLMDAAPEARVAALAATAGAATSAMQLNQMGCALTDQRPRAELCVPVADCAQVAELLLGGLPAAYTVAAQAISGSPHNGSTRCTVSLADGSASAEFIGIASGGR